MKLDGNSAKTLVLNFGFKPNSLYLSALVQTMMTANVNIYVAGDVVVGALANPRRCAANLMHVPCLSEEGDHLSRNL